MENEFEKLEELIKDDNQIVTVISFSQISNISIEKSQKLINKYVEINKESGELYPTYILNGIRKDTGELSITQVNDENIEDVKQLYEDTPTVILFSIQRSKSIDYNVISLVTSNDNLPKGQIIGKNCIQRVLGKKVLPPLPAATLKGKSTIFMKQNSSRKSDEKIRDETKTEKNNLNKASAKGSIASMFNKATQNKKTAEQKPNENGGLSTLLTKPLSKDIIDKNKEKFETKAEEMKEIKDQNKSISDIFDSDTDEEILKDLNIKEEIHKEVMPEKKTSNKKSTPKNNKRKKTNAINENSAKRRKRIIVEESDSDDEIFATEKSDNEEILMDVEEEPEPVKQLPKEPVPKNKRRKAIKKTYEDDEGFIVTQTEYVYETASEDENVPENNITQTKPIEKKTSNHSQTEISSNKGSKIKKGSKKAPAVNQPTLMSFLKKK